MPFVIDCFPQKVWKPMDGNKSMQKVFSYQTKFTPMRPSSVDNKRMQGKEQDN